MIDLAACIWVSYIVGGVLAAAAHVLAAAANATRPEAEANPEKISSRL